MAEVEETSPGVVRMATRLGRPRLDGRPGFRIHFAAILPRLRAGEITKREAAGRDGDFRALCEAVHGKGRRVRLSPVRRGSG